MLSDVEQALSRQAAVCLLGPRQVGKTTLALEVAASRPSVYLDLERPADRARLEEPEQYLAAHEDELVILDEVQRVPGLFDLPGGRLWAFEVKRSMAPKPARGFHFACDDVQPERRILVYPGEESFPTAGGVEVMGLRSAAQAVRDACR